MDRSSTAAPGGDGLLRTGLTAVADALLLGLVCVAGCALVVTAVPSLAAAYGVVELRRTEPAAPVVGSFVTAFRRQLRRGSAIGLIAAIWWMVVAVDLLYVVAHPSGLPRSIVLALAVLASLVGLAVTAWLPSLLHHRDDGVQDLLRIAVVLGFGRPAATTVCLLVLGGSGMAALAVPPLAPLVVYVAVRVLAWQTSGQVAPTVAPGG